MLVPVLSGVRRILPPAAFPFAWGGQVYLVGTRYFTNYNIQASKPAYGGTIFCGGGGDNTKDGLTYANRVRSFKLAVTKANALAVSLAVTTIRIQIDDGYYYASNTSAGSIDAWTNTSPTCSLVIEVNKINGVGRAINVSNLTNPMPGFVATSDPNIYVSTYVAQTPARTIVDIASPDPDGLPALFAEVRAVADVANPWPEINAAWALYSPSGLGAMFLDTTNKKAYVRRRSNAAPDANVIFLSGTNSTSAGFAGATTGAFTIWMEDLEFWGGNGSGSAGGGPFRMIATSVIPLTLFANRCKFVGGGATNAFGWSGGPGFSTMVNCVASYAEMDGFNYHGLTSATDDTTCPKFVEINCTARWNGWDGGGVNNGSTCHEFVRGIRLGCQYYNNADRAVDDINSARSWNLGVRASARRGLDATENSSAFSAGIAASSYATTIWLDGCSVVPNYAGALPQFPFEAYANGVLNYTRMASLTKPAGAPGAGTFTKY